MTQRLPDIGQTVRLDGLTHLIACRTGPFGIQRALRDRVGANVPSVACHGHCPPCSVASLSKRLSAIGMFLSYQRFQSPALSPPKSRIACRARSKMNRTRMLVPAGPQFHDAVKL